MRPTFQRGGVLHGTFIGIKEWEIDGLIDGIIGVQWFSMVFIVIHNG